MLSVTHSTEATATWNKYQGIFKHFSLILHPMTSELTSGFVWQRKTRSLMI